MYVSNTDVFDTDIISNTDIIIFIFIFHFIRQLFRVRVQ